MRHRPARPGWDFNPRVVGSSPTGPTLVFVLPRRRGERELGVRLLGDTPSSDGLYLLRVALIRDGETVTDVAARFGVARKTVHAWLAKDEPGGLENLQDGSHRPRPCPHQMDAAIEVSGSSTTANNCCAPSNATAEGR